MPEPKTRRRGAELEQAILDATWEVLRETGYTNLTIEAVAARAQTSKPVIYRRWPNRAKLVLAAWGHQAPETRTAPPDTGSLRGDLLALFGYIAMRIDKMMNEMISGVMSDTFRHPEITAVLRAQLRASPLAVAMDSIVARAVARNELPHVELPTRVTRLPLDLVRNEAMTFGAPVDDDTVAELVDDVYLPLLRGLANH
jgi:AcrR family transcriptional regulator